MGVRKGRILFTMIVYAAGVLSAVYFLTSPMAYEGEKPTFSPVVESVSVAMRKCVAFTKSASSEGIEKIKTKIQQHKP